MTEPSAPDLSAWTAALDALEARVSQQENALVAGVAEGGFEAVLLPSTPPSEGDRVRAMLALQRVQSLEAQLRRLHERAPQPLRASPYS
jgi:hypothetical protein